PDDGRAVAVRPRVGLSVLVDVGEGRADAAGHVGHEPVLEEMPAVARGGDDRDDADLADLAATRGAEVGLAALDLQLDAPVPGDVVAQAAAEEEVRLGADVDVTREVLVESEVHAGDEVEVET